MRSADAARRSPAAAVPVFLVFAACAFASGFALRLADPIVLPVATHFAITPATRGDAQHRLRAALRAGAAVPRPDRRPLRQAALHPGLRRRPRRDARCSAPSRPTFALLMATRIGAGIFAGGLIPLVLAGLGDTYDMSERQVMIGRMLFAIISGQMLGSVVSGFANDAFGWHSALVIGAGVGAVAAAIAWLAMPAGASAAASRDGGSFADALRPRPRQPEGALADRRRRRRRHVLLRPLPVHGRAAAGDGAAGRRLDRGRHRPRPRRLRHRRPALRRSACAPSCACSACAACA